MDTTVAQHTPNTTLPAGDKIISTELQWIIIVGTSIAVVACLLNSLALLIFIRYKSSSVKSGIRTLTIVEILLTISRVVADILLLTNEFGIFPYIFTLTGTLLCLRNWWIAVITICRCIAILKPLKASQMLKPSRQLATFIILICTSGTLNALRHVWSFNFNSTALNLPVFVFQVGLPVPIVLVTSFSMVVYLVSTSTRNMPVAMRNMRRASQTVLQLAVVFTILQSPTFIHTVVTSLKIQRQTFWNTVCNLLSVTDSSANFFIFMVNSRNFQRGLCRLFFRQVPGSLATGATTIIDRSGQHMLSRRNLQNCYLSSEVLSTRSAGMANGTSRESGAGVIPRGNFLEPNNVVYHFPATNTSNNSRYDHDSDVIRITCSNE